MKDGKIEEQGNQIQKLIEENKLKDGKIENLELQITNLTQSEINNKVTIEGLGS